MGIVIPSLNFSQQFLILIRRNKRNRKTTCAKSSSSTNSMKITIRTIRHIVIYHNIDTFNINTVTEDISCNTDSFIEIFETLITSDTTCQLTLVERGGSYRSSWGRPPWMVIDGKLHSRNNLSNSEARPTDLTKITTWLNSNASRRSLSLRFFWASGRRI